MNLSAQTRFKNLGFIKKENCGLDTETFKGYVYLIADDSGRHLCLNNIEDKFLEIIKFMTHKKFRHNFNWFYNIKYDFESIVKYLDEDLLRSLYETKKLEYEQFSIFYLDRKFISIKDEHKHYYYFYDLFNFLETSLNKASKKYLHDQKLDIINAERLNKEWLYWIKHKKEIIEYCIYDASLTKRLADYFWDLIYEKLSYYPKRPFSKGKLSEEYFLHKCYIPTINDLNTQYPHVLKFAYNAYSGGRFEVLKRGFFPDIFVYDIKSAYPYEMTKLMDYNLGKWINVRNMSEDVELGFYHCQCSALENNFSPFLYRRGGLNFYPNGKITPNPYLTNFEINFIRNNFENSNIKILEGWEFIPHNEVYPYKDEIERLYNWKEKEKDEDIKYCVKIILNSLYGKTIQTIGGRTGKLFNPIYASLITSGTRIKLLEFGLKNSDNVIAFSTDSIASKKYLYTSSNPKLGDFASEFTGSGIYLMSDVYTLWNEDRRKHKFRGFTIYKDTIPTLFDILNIRGSEDNIGLLEILHELDKSTKYPFKIRSPYHLGECLIHKKTKNVGMINIFRASTKDIDINGDKRRFWMRDFKNGEDVLENNINSYPLKFF